METLWTQSSKGGKFRGTVSSDILGDQREGFFSDSILEGQVIFTKKDGTTIIEQWENGEQVKRSGKEKVQQNLAEGNDELVSNLLPGEQERGEKRANFFVKDFNIRSEKIGQQSRRRTKQFLLDIYKSVNS